MRLTIFTPAYNRSELIKRTYDSLKRQTVKDFEWLIVDDGSTDNTRDVVEGFISEGILEIRYFYTENGGKMRAHNLGAKLAKAPLFLCVDSDDFLTDDAVEELLECYFSHKSLGARYYRDDRTNSFRICENTTKTDCVNVLEEKNQYEVRGVVAHKGASGGELLGEKEFPELFANVSTLYDLYLKGFSGETTLMYETELLRQFPFPEIEGEKYVPEDYIYDKIDGVCVLAVLPKIVTVCEIVASGYTDSVKKLKINNPVAWYLYYEQRAFITPPSALKLKYLGRYIIYSKRSGKGIRDSKRIGLLYKFAGILMAVFLLIIRKE